MKDPKFMAQVALLVRVLPFIAEEKVFALKGGTAINLFVWNMPRLSIDIDLAYLPLKARDESLKDIANAIKRIKQRIEAAIKGCRVIPINVSGTGTPTSLTVQFQDAQIKVEVNFVLRGCVYPTINCELCPAAQKEFGALIEIATLSRADLYGGKLCAALDRQHPRDFFDIKTLLENDGITDEVRTAFVVYLASHSRPMNELLNPTWKDISQSFETDFRGMTAEHVSLAELLSARDLMLKTLRRTLTEPDKQFLLSVKQAEPDWSLLNMKGIDMLPGLQWKLTNVKKMSSVKRDVALEKLKAALDLK